MSAIAHPPNLRLGDDGETNRDNELLEITAAPRDQCLRLSGHTAFVYPAATTAPPDARQRPALPHTRRRRDHARACALRVAAALHCALYRSTGGSVGATIRGRPVLLLTTVGRKSGRARTSPVCFLRAGRGLVVAAAAGGLSRHPAWYLNLLAHPQVAVQLGSMRQRMVARVASGVERALLWDRFCLHYPVCAAYAEKSGRVIPVVVLCSAPGHLGERPVSP